jgi:hypothetical protein
MSGISPLWQFGISDFSTSEPLKNGELIVANGLDFIEPGLAKVAAMSEEDFLTEAARLETADVPVLSANWFLPPNLKVVGPEIGLAADFYHFAMEGEGSDVMREAADLICAVQLANPNGRCFPKPEADIPGIDAFFEHLAGIGYRGGVSVEATVGEDFAADCAAAAQFFENHCR